MAVMTAPIQTERVKKSRLSTVDFSNLGFGTYISDHMVAADYKNGEWLEPKIVPYGEMMMSPAILALHYGQSVFEGMKAFKSEGGTGYAKCASNYGGAFYPTMLAQKQGFDQVFWTDAKEHKYIEESGAMNVMFVLNGKLVTPKLVSTLLDGVTRDSILTLTSSLGIEKEERRVSIAELEEGFKNGFLKEAFGVGTAAVVSPIASISIHGKNYELPPVGPDSFQLRAKKKLNDIRMGIEADVHGWNYLVK